MGEVQQIYQDISHLMDTSQETVEQTIGMLCQNLTISPMSMALLVYWLIQNDRRDHVVYKQFMMVFDRAKHTQQEEEVHA
jgi:hypothetical protein